MASFKPLLMTVFLAMVLALGGCGDQNNSGVVDTPRDLSRDDVCMLDGMILLDYPGPKGQLFYKNGEARFFCDTKGLISTLYDPNYKAKIRSAYVQDFGGREWGSYGDRWVDISQAFLVMDGGKFGAMGPTIATFGSREDADAFAAKNGGTVLPFSELDENRFEDYLKRVRQQLRELTDLKAISEEPESAKEGHSQHNHAHNHE